jgi:biopolymer transport protein ExbD
MKNDGEKTRNGWRGLFLVTAGVIALALPLVVGMPAAPRRAQAPNSQPLQKGLHVNLSPALNAISLPETDEAGAIVVAVSPGGKAYLGGDPVASSELTQRVRSLIANWQEKDKIVFIKADSATHINAVNAVGLALSDAGVDHVDMLTEHVNSAGQPMERGISSGLPVLLPPRNTQAKTLRQASDSVTVSILEGTIVKIDGRTVAWDALGPQLRDVYKTRTDKLLLVSGDKDIPFQFLARAIDAARGVDPSIEVGLLIAKN